jgi:hypothetical protein
MLIVLYFVLPLVDNICSCQKLSVVTCTFGSSEMRHSVVVCVVPDVLKYRSAVVFRVVSSAGFLTRKYFSKRWHYDWAPYPYRTET